MKVPIDALARLMAPCVHCGHPIGYHAETDEASICPICMGDPEFGGSSDTAGPCVVEFKNTQCGFCGEELFNDPTVFVGKVHVDGESMYCTESHKRAAREFKGLVK